jgi:hypothetical protein
MHKGILKLNIKKPLVIVKNNKLENVEFKSDE